jgi:hypothetical protein
MPPAVAPRLTPASVSRLPPPRAAKAGVLFLQADGVGPTYWHGWLGWASRRTIAWGGEETVLTRGSGFKRSGVGQEWAKVAPYVGTMREQGDVRRLVTG